MRRGEIWLANLNPGRGTEPGKTRPVLIVQAQVLLDAQHPSTLIAPMTTQLIENAEPLRMRIKAHAGLDKDSDILLDQLRAIDNNRLMQGPLCTLSAAQMRCIDQDLLEVLDLFEAHLDLDASRRPELPPGAN